MIINSQNLLVLLALTSFINASSPDLPDNLSPANIHDPVDDIIEQLSALNLTEFESNIAIGLKIWIETRNNNMDTIVMLLDREIAKVTKYSNDFDSAAVLLHGFLEASDTTYDKTVESIVKTALISHSFSLLRTLTILYVWSSPEQFHWFRALGYKSEWYDPTVWKNAPVPVDWNKNLHTVFKADNPILLNDLVSGVLLENPPALNDDALLDLIVEHDSLNIYQSLSPIPTIHLETLIESESFKILQFLAKSQSSNLHLEDYHPPHTLPRDFEFFWMQGYRYLPVSHFLALACKRGHDGIIEFLYQLNPRIVGPSNNHLVLAANNGHLNVIEWALDHDLPVNITSIAPALLLNGHFKAFEQLQKRLEPPTCVVQYVSNVAAQQDDLNVIKWVYEKFKIVPESDTLDNAGIKILEWIESVDPRKITTRLAMRANVNTLEWLLKNHPNLLTDKVKRSHRYRQTNFEKVLWMDRQGWKLDFSMLEAVCKGDLEMIKFGYNSHQLKPTHTDANLAAQHGHTKVLELIYSKSARCIDRGALSEAIRCGHLESAEYLESILNLKGTTVHFNLDTAFKSGNLELIQWVYGHYNSDQLEDGWIQAAIRHGHLHIIHWVIKSRFILKTDEEYLMIAAQYGQSLMFQCLIDYGIAITMTKDLVKLAFESKNLEILRCLVAKNPKSAQDFKNEKITIDNYHMMQWLQDQGFWAD